MNFASDLENYKFSWGDLKNMGKLFWATSIVFSTGGITVYTLTDLMTDISQNRFAHTYLEAKNYLSYIEMIVIVMVPLLSLIIMKIGHKTSFLIAGSTILVGSYTIMMLQPYVGINQTMFSIAVAGVGIHFSIYLTAIEPAIALVAPKEVMSIAYGVSSLFLMLPLSVLPYICGKISIKRTPYEYQKVLYILFGLSLLNIIATLVLFFTDLKHGKLLLLPENKPEVEVGREKANKRFVKNSKSTSLRSSFRSSMIGTENTLASKLSAT